VQARVEFFTKHFVNQALTRNARKPGERGRDKPETVMRFAARPRARMASMLSAIVIQHEFVWGELVR